MQSYSITEQHIKESQNNKKVNAKTNRNHSRYVNKKQITHLRPTRLFINSVV